MSNNVTSLSDTSINFINPATQTPLFTAEWVTCAFPISDLYASSPRYLYYALLVLVFVTQWHSWLANVFLGVVATYAGTAAIEAFILMANRHALPETQQVSIPYIDPASVSGNETLSAIKNLVMNATAVEVQPAVLEFDIDAILAITVTGYLMMLPMHCWSSAVRANRARHFLILLWNALMLAGMICSIVLWPRLYSSPLQFRFCYPTLLDSDSVTSDGLYDSSFRLDTWNATIWNMFSNFSIAADLNNNCLYPCFNTTQILRRPSSLVADVSTDKSPRINSELDFSGVAIPLTDVEKEFNLAFLMYAALIVTTIIMIVLLAFLLSPARSLTRVPIDRPKELLWSARKELFHVLWKEFVGGVVKALLPFRSPSEARRRWRATSSETLRRHIGMFLRFLLDIVALIILFIAMILTPGTIIVFVVWIERYIHRDLISSEAPQQVGQWTSSVSVALVLVSALVLRLRYPMASEREIADEIANTKEHLERLEELLAQKQKRRGEKDAQEMRRRQMLEPIELTARSKPSQDDLRLTHAHSV